MRFLLTCMAAAFLLFSCSKSKTDPDIPPGTNPTSAEKDSLGTWQVKKVDNLSRPLTDVTFLSATTGYTCGGDYALLKTTDGGTTWQAMNNIPGQNYVNIQFLNSQYGFITTYANSITAANTGILRTVNGGANWQFATTATGSVVYDVFFINPVTGYCTTDNGLLKSTDSGKTWLPSAALSTHSTGLWFANATKGFVSTSVSTGSLLLKTSDGGNSFSTAVTAGPATYSPIYFSDALNGCAGLGVDLYRTTDGGTTWQNLKRFDKTIIDAKNIGSNELYVNIGSEIWHTANGGTSWERDLKVTSNKFLVEFTFTQPGRIWLSADSGRLYYK